MEVSAGHHWVVTFWGVSCNMDTLITMWIVMAILLIVSFLATRNLSIIPNKFQAFLENLMSFFWGMTSSMGESGKKHTPLLASLFLFILTANLIGQIPWRIYHLPDGELASPTNDINMTLAMALVVLFYYIIAGVIKKGPKYFLHYFKPMPVLAPLNMMEDIIRPFSLSVRLFANILAGEVLIMVMLGLGTQMVAKLPFLGALLPLPFMFFEIFVAVIQALVFTLLSSAYLSLATDDGH